MDRKTAFSELKKRVKNKNLIKHMLATEAVMAALAERLGENKESWMLAGLLHDIDYEETKNQPERHGLRGAEILEEMGLPQEVVYAVKAHNPIHNLLRNSNLDKALYAVDPLTGLIVACALIIPEKRLSKIDSEFVLRRFKERGCAAGANREQINTCSEFGLSLEEFVDIALKAMQNIAGELGL